MFSKNKDGYEVPKSTEVLIIFSIINNYQKSNALQIKSHTNKH